MLAMTERAVLAVISLFTLSGGTITWHEPPPVTTETDDAVVSTADSIQLFKGHSGSLSWNFTLTGEWLASVVLTSKNKTVATIMATFGTVAVKQGFKDRFNVSWIDSQRATLIIFNVTIDDKGYFTCNTKSVAGGAIKVWTRKILVAVVDNSMIDQGPLNAAIVEGENVTFHCNATGDPTPNITWTKDGSPTVLYQGEVYSISNIQRQADGNYTCTAWNGVGRRDNATATVAVHYASVIDMALSNMTVVERENVTLHCNATGNPTPNITWTKDGSATTLYQGETYSISNIKRQAAGDYTCTAWNGVGQHTNATATVTVYYNSMIDQRPLSAAIIEGENITFHCNATGDPTPNITWAKDGSPTVLYQGETYSISNIQRRADGNYTCTAWNGVGQRDNATATLAVHYASVFDMALSNMTVVERENVTLHCNATGNPTPNITWTKDGSATMLHQGEMYSIVNIKRQVAGDYTCTAWNGVGQHANATATVTVHLILV